MEYPQENNIISHDQHGFVPGRSCMTQLLDVMDTWTATLDEGGNLEVIYMDFQQAFESVPHHRLMEKVSACGIRGRLHSWISNFLAHRTQPVVINGVHSKEGQVTSGIPQGSVLGPLLFVIYINDLPSAVKSCARIFADDTKLLSRADSESDTEALQRDLDELQEWSDKWLLRFHPQKCCVLKMGQKKRCHILHEQQRQRRGANQDTAEGNRGGKGYWSGDRQQAVLQGTHRSSYSEGKPGCRHHPEIFWLPDPQRVHPDVQKPGSSYSGVWRPHLKGLCAESEGVLWKIVCINNHGK